MTTSTPPPRLNARSPCKELVRLTSGNAYAEVSARYAGGGAGYDRSGMVTGQRISDANKAGSGLSGQAGSEPANQADQAAKAAGGLSRRRALTIFGVGAGALIAEQVLVADEVPPSVAAQAQA